jgi:hypothetical protein
MGKEICVRLPKLGQDDRPTLIQLMSRRQAVVIYPEKLMVTSRYDYVNKSP